MPPEGTSSTASHQVKLADSGSNGNGVPLTVGATLVIVFRDPQVPTLSSIVISDGGFSLNHGSDVITQTFRGSFPSYVNPQAKLTTIIGEGQGNFSERLLFNGQVVAGGINPFRGTWDNPTFDVSTLLPGNAASATIQDRSSGFFVVRLLVRRRFYLQDDRPGCGYRRAA